MSNLTSALWWKAATLRALRTALVVAAAFVPTSHNMGEIPFVVIASSAGLAFVLSLLTSLAGIAEVEGTSQPWYFAIVSRVVKTIAQTTVAGIGTSVLITEVDWATITQVALTAGFGSLLLAVISRLPESEEPIAPASVTINSIQIEGGEVSETRVPVVATVVPTSNEKH